MRDDDPEVTTNDVKVSDQGLSRLMSTDVAGSVYQVAVLHDKLRLAGEALTGRNRHTKLRLTSRSAVATFDLSTRITGPVFNRIWTNNGYAESSSTSSNRR
jgi:hypothetical protein